MGRSITISKKHGVNPSILHCECCGKEYGLALLGKLKGDVEAPKDIRQGFCDDCQKVIDQKGLMIIEVRDGESGNNPYRTGRIVGITKDAKERVFKDVNSPIVYMEQSLFNQVFGEVEFTQ